MTTKTGIFISHIHEESKLGAVVKSWMTDAFHGNAAPFLSSDKQDLPAGSRWLDVIESQIAESGVMISLLSPTSLARPWVNIELGAAWKGGVSIIPLCHSGLTATALPRPFGDFTALTLDDASAAKNLIAGGAKALGLTYSQRLAFAECLKEMRAAAAKSELVQVAATGVEIAPAVDLPQEQSGILQALAAAANDGMEEVSVGDAGKMTGLTAAVFKYHAAELEDADYIYIGRDMTGTYCRITPKGSGWLIKNKLMPD